MTNGGAWRPDYSRIRSPALVVYSLATLEQRRPCVAGSPDRERARRAKAFLDRRFRPYQQAGVDQVRRRMPSVRVVELQGHHFLFISNQDEVVREMRRFLLNGR